MYLYLRVHLFQTYAHAVTDKKFFFIDLKQNTNTIGDVYLYLDQKTTN